MPQRYRDPATAYRLGQWVGVQRRSNETVTPERRQRLDALGFVWDSLEARWEEGFRSLERFHQREGHCQVPHGHREGGYRLGSWISNQRSNQETMSPARRARLDALGFVWDTFEAQWEEGFCFLELFCQREGHCHVPRHYREGEYRLGQWVHSQRQGRDAMLPERRQRLEALKFIWDPLATDWEEGFSYLQRFHQREGHCRVPQRHREGDYRLGHWVGTQRQGRDTMLPERLERLDALGFVWKVR